MNNKGQIAGIISFIVIVLGILLLAPILVTVVTSTTGKFSDSLVQVDTTNKTSNTINEGKNKFTSMIDWVILFILIFNVLLILITAFFIDTHPLLLVIYIGACFFLMVFAPSMLEGLNQIWNSDKMVDAQPYLQITGYILDNFGLFILGVMALSGIVMFGKFMLRGGTNGQGY